jgi:diamine N-acetyltransferase
MNSVVYLRPLSVNDASISYRWRNMPEIWRFTKAAYANEITLETEKAWLSGVLKRKDQRRFAICLKKNDQYIGNVQLLDITQTDASYHIFIGETCCWGKGIAQAVTLSVMNYAFRDLNLQKVSLHVHMNNFAGIAVYLKIGFHAVAQEESFIIMELSQSRFKALNFQ